MKSFDDWVNDMSSEGWNDGRPSVVEATPESDVSDMIKEAHRMIKELLDDEE
jgi:hypothetical protein